MTFPEVTAAQWRALVDKELAGASFDKTFVTKTPDGLSVQPLYTEAARTHALGARAPFQVCMHHDDGASRAVLVDDLDNGADALWLNTAALKLVQHRDAFFVIDGELPADFPVERRFAVLGNGANAKRLAAKFPNCVAAMVSTLRFHEAGADAADELALALSSGVAALESMLASGMTAEAAGKQVGFQLSVGRDTFGELCKLRALRVCWQKILAAAKAGPPRTLVHAVCATRTLTQRDPWVNMLRATTQSFAAVLGGADLVTPWPFDRALGAPSALAHRVARNTGLVLRDESALGRVSDPAEGAYALETITDELAREAWTRFQQFEKGGGATAGRLDAAWKARAELVAKRRAPILGVSEFANLDEVLPQVPTAAAVSGHRDAEIFEALRARAETRKAEVVLFTLGEPAESRARVGFATNLFAAGGIRARETAADEKATIACVCGTDERYASEAVARVKALKAAGCKHVLLAGKPGALEGPLREAGLDGFIFLGCDALATLTEVLS